MGEEDSCSEPPAAAAAAEAAAADAAATAAEDVTFNPIDPGTKDELTAIEEDEEDEEDGGDGDTPSRPPRIMMGGCALLLPYRPLFVRATEFAMNCRC